MCADMYLRLCADMYLRAYLYFINIINIDTHVMAQTNQMHQHSRTHTHNVRTCYVNTIVVVRVRDCIPMYKAIEDRIEEV